MSRVDLSQYYPEFKLNNPSASTLELPDTSLPTVESKLKQMINAANFLKSFKLQQPQILAEQPPAVIEPQQPQLTVMPTKTNWNPGTSKLATVVAAFGKYLEDRNNLKAEQERLAYDQYNKEQAARAEAERWQKQQDYIDTRETSRDERRNQYDIEKEQRQQQDPLYQAKVAGALKSNELLDKQITHYGQGNGSGTRNPMIKETEDGRFYQFKVDKNGNAYYQEVKRDSANQTVFDNVKDVVSSILGTGSKSSEYNKMQYMKMNQKEQRDDQNNFSNYLSRINSIKSNIEKNYVGDPAGLENEYAKNKELQLYNRALEGTAYYKFLAQNQEPNNDKKTVVNNFLKSQDQPIDRTKIAPQQRAVTSETINQQKQIAKQAIAAGKRIADIVPTKEQLQETQSQKEMSNWFRSLFGDEVKLSD